MKKQKKDTSKCRPTILKNKELYLLWFFQPKVQLLQAFSQAMPILCSRLWWCEIQFHRYYPTKLCNVPIATSLLELTRAQIQTTTIVVFWGAESAVGLFSASSHDAQCFCRWSNERFRVNKSELNWIKQNQIEKWNENQNQMIKSVKNINQIEKKFHLI